MQTALWNVLFFPGRALRKPRVENIGLSLHYGHTVPFPGVPNCWDQGCVCEQPELARVATPALIKKKKVSATYESFDRCIIIILKVLKIPYSLPHEPGGLGSDWTLS